MTNWFAPLVVSFIGPRPTLFFGGIFYVLFIAQIMYPMNILLYMGSALLGFGGAMMWVAQGHFLTINSSPETMERNSGFFFAIFQSSQVWGNAYVYFEFQDLFDIDRDTRITVITIFN